MEEQTGAVTDFTPGCSNYLKQGERGHLGRPQITREYLWVDLIRQKPFLFFFFKKEVF